MSRRSLTSEDELSASAEDESSNLSVGVPEPNSHTTTSIDLYTQCAQPCLSQTQSPLFSVLPAETRNQIFMYALHDYEDLEAKYDEKTCYRRPQYLAPRRTDIALLQTCQLVYREAWFRPLTSAQHTFYFTRADRRPEKEMTIPKLQPILTLMHTLHASGDTATDIELDSIRIFAQLFQLEDGKTLRIHFAMLHFLPKSITITLRHTDWWYWEEDAPLRIAAGFVRTVRLPNSVREVRMELESLVRKREQVKSVAGQMVDKWEFWREDGTVLAAKDGEGREVEMPDEWNWTGSSTWSGQRWLRDEARPEEVDFHVRTVRFVVKRRKMPVGADDTPDKVVEENTSPDLFAIDPEPPLRAPFAGRVATYELESAMIAPGTPAQSVFEQIRAHRTQPPRPGRRRIFWHR